jgi:glutamate dehydrogenase (NAD(P)+)
VMAWLMDEYSRMHGYSPAVVTGKPLDLGGSEGREAATGRGTIFVLEEYLKDLGRALPDTTVAIQGFGNVGSFAARIAHEGGANVVAVSDVTGAIHHPNGLDIPAIQAWVKQRKRLVDYEADGVSRIEPDALLFLEVDALIPAALGGVFTAENAKEVRAKVILEAANAPTEPEADEIFEKAGIPVIPDILANAGGVTVSYFEWAQNIQCLRWTEDEVNTRLHHIMSGSYATVRNLVKQRNLNWRTAAFVVALGRVAKATVLRGI